MASKQPFKFFDLAQKLTVWSIRINKFFNHKLLSKRKNVLLISDSSKNNILPIQFHILNRKNDQLIKIQTKKDNLNKNNQQNFERLLINNLLKTWQTTKLESLNLNQQEIENLLNKYQKENVNKDLKNQQKVSQNHLSMVAISSFSHVQSVKKFQMYLSQKKKFYDSIVVLPEPQISSQSQYPEIEDQFFATDFIDIYQTKIMKNIVAYRLAHKFLTTSGTFIQSTSQYDFLKKQNTKKVAIQEDKDQNILTYSEKRPTAGKQLIDNTICYLGIVIGDRDYTDINSWTLVSLSQEASIKNPQYIAKMYYDWVDGQNLPMPGSFTLFKKKIIQKNKKELNFVQYL